MTGLEVRDGVEVNYHFCFDEDQLILTVKALASWPNPTMESLAQDLPAALWIEREIHDLLGVSFEGHPDLRRLILPDDWPEGSYPLRRDFRK
jgi:Ni,Fe-hydrogenase III component G